MRYGKNNFPAPANMLLCVLMCLLLVSKKPLGEIHHHHVHCCIQLSLKLESFYLPIKKLYGFICNSALWGSLLCKQIFFRLILISLLAHACPTNGDMIPLRDMKTTAFSYPYTQWKLNSDSPNHKAVCGLLKSNFKQQRVWPHSDSLFRTQAHTKGP